MPDADRFTGARQRIVHNASRPLALTEWPPTDYVYINIAWPVFGAWDPVAMAPGPLERFPSPFHLILEPYVSTEDIWTYYQDRFHLHPAEHPIGGVAVTMVLSSDGGFLPGDFALESRLLLASSAGGSFEPYGDWTAGGTISGIFYGTAAYDAYVGITSLPFVGGVPPLGYIKLEIRGSFPSYGGMVRVQYMIFNVARRYRESEI